MSENKFKDWTNEEYLDFISDLVNDGLEKYADDNIYHATGMALLASNNLISYLRRLQGSAKT